MFEKRFVEIVCVCVCACSVDGWSKYCTSDFSVAQDRKSIGISMDRCRCRPLAHLYVYRIWSSNQGPSKKMYIKYQRSDEILFCDVWKKKMNKFSRWQKVKIDSNQSYERTIKQFSGNLRWKKRKFSKSCSVNAIYCFRLQNFYGLFGTKTVNEQVYTYIEISLVSNKIFRTFF